MTNTWQLQTWWAIITAIHAWKISYALILINLFLFFFSFQSFYVQVWVLPQHLQCGQSISQSASTALPADVTPIYARINFWEEWRGIRDQRFTRCETSFCAKLTVGDHLHGFHKWDTKSAKAVSLSIRIKWQRKTLKCLMRQQASGLGLKEHNCCLLLVFTTGLAWQHRSLRTRNTQKLAL